MNLKKKTKTKPQGKRKFHLFRFITLLLAVAVGFEVVGGLVGLYALNTMLAGEPELKVEDFNTRESTLVFDRNGEQLADVGTQLRENITYEEIPEALVDAFLSVEDSRYFVHNGFDIPRFMASVVKTVLEHNTQGGSTFTMQLVKLTYFTNDEEGTSKTKDIQYKLQQIDLALKLEKELDKKSVFEMYMNKMSFGGIGNIRGVEKASEQYYGKRVSELNISECAMLAGVVNSPYYYNPYLYLDHATERRNTVLYQMLNHGYITKEQYTLAKSIKVEDLLLDPYKQDDTAYAYQAYIDYALKEAQEVTGQDPLNVSMEIYTAMDKHVQETMENIQAGKNTQVQFADDLMECGILSMNNQNGEIIAIGGGRNYAKGGSMLLNHATEQYKQPGSAVKPFLDYAPAFDYLGWATTHVLVDKAITYGNWTYKNANGQYYGRVDLEESLVRSLNTPAIQTCQAVIDELGKDYYVNYMKQLGFDTGVSDNFDISYSIGGNNFTCTVKQLAGAHSALVNGGNYITPHAITKIVYRHSDEAPVVPNYTPVSVLSEGACYMVDTLLERCVQTSIFNYMQILKRDYKTYAKTGTSDWGDAGLEYGIPFGAMKDKWMVAETSQYTSCVWIGYEKAEKGKDTYISTQKAYMNIPGHIMSEVIDSIEESFGKPEEIKQPAEGLTKITHVAGIFPYVKATKEIPSKYISTGLVKTEYSKLGTFKEKIPALSNLTDFSTNYKDGQLIINWAKYPGKNISEEDTQNSETFNIAWITGKVKYLARVMVNGVTVGELSSTKNSLTQKYNLPYDSNIQVCGYYGYSNTGDISNELCTTFDTGPDPTITPTPVPTPIVFPIPTPDPAPGSPGQP